MSTKHCAMAVGAALLAVRAGGAEAGRIDYSVDAGVERNDNVTLVETGEISQNILRAGLGFLATEDTSALQMRLGGRVEYRNYTDNAYSDSVEGDLSALLNWVAIQDRLSFTAENRLEVQAINPFAVDTPDNRQQINVFSVGPNFYFMRGSTFQGQAELRYVDSHAEETEEFNSSRVGAAVRMYKDLSDASRVSFNYQFQDIDFDDDASAIDHRRNDLFARFEREYNILSLSADAGYSRAAFDGGARHSGPLLRAGLVWRPSERSRFAVDGAKQLSDAATTFLGDVMVPGAPGGRIPRDILIGTEIVTAAVYEERSVAIGYTYTGDVTSFGVTSFLRRLDYIESALPDEDREGVTVGFDRALGPTLSLSLGYSKERVEYEQIPGRFDTSRFGLSLGKRWSRHWASYLSLERNRWTSPVIATDVDQYILYLSIVYSNR